MALEITITDAGRAELINAENTGTGPVVVSEIRFGTGQYTPVTSQTALQAEVKSVSTIAGQAVAEDTIHVIVKDESSDTYDVGEFGLYAASGTLLAVYSQIAASGWIIEKSSPATLLLAVDIVLESLDATNITFGDVSFINPPATETVIGVAEIATQTETDAGTDDARIVTPKKLASRLASFIKNASTTVKGIVELATDTEAITGTDSVRAVTPKGMRAHGDDRYSQKGHSHNLTWGAVQITGYVNSVDAVVDYTVPDGCVLVGEYSVHNQNAEDRQFKFRYRSIT